MTTLILETAYFPPHIRAWGDHYRKIDGNKTIFSLDFTKIFYPLATHKNKKGRGESSFHFVRVMTL